MAMDDVELICSVGELAGAFENSRNLAEFLRAVVVTVAAHMKATACSIYLHEAATGDLVLQATKGLRQDALGRVRLSVREGLVGQTIREMRPVCESVASENPNFKPIPGIDEEAHQAFLAVPITRGSAPVGVLVVQHVEAGYFGPDEVKVMRAIASQLASTLENAKLLLMVEQSQGNGALAKEPGPIAFVAEVPPFIAATAAAPGIASGPAAPVGRLHGEMRADELVHVSSGLGIGEFERAVSASMAQLEVLQKRVEQYGTDVNAALIFSAQLLMLMDDAFTGRMRALIAEETRVAEAVATVVDRYTAIFGESRDAHLREKVQDVQDVGHRLLRNLVDPDAESADYAGCVVVTADLLPSDMMKLATQGVAGLIIMGGSITSHVAVLSRALGIPLVLSRSDALKAVPEGAMLLVDGTQGHIFVNPGPDVMAQYDLLREDHEWVSELGGRVTPQTHTADGVRIHLLANINLLHELEIATALKAEGVGLYRSEFPFIIRNECPTEEEQVRTYRVLFDKMAGKPVVLRTLDVGGDKMLAYLAAPDEDNPSMGLRAIRFTLLHVSIFKDQLRAMCRAGAGHDLRIMLPMVGSVDDLRRARVLLQECLSDLRESGLAHNPEPKVGVMIELPSAVELAEDLARESDFLSIGTNDLVQYMLAVDRTNPFVSDYYAPHHPAVLRALKRVADAAAKHKRPLSLCGEIARDPAIVPFLIGIGVTALSMDSRSIPSTQAHISALRASDCERLAAKALAVPTIAEAASLLGIV